MDYADSDAARRSCGRYGSGSFYLNSSISHITYHISHIPVIFWHFCAIFDSQGGGMPFCVLKKV